MIQQKNEAQNISFFRLFLEKSSIIYHYLPLRMQQDTVWYLTKKLYIW